MCCKSANLLVAFDLPLSSVPCRLQVLTMRLHQHIIASAAFGSAVYGATGSGDMAAASLVSGILIDVDHVLDHLANSIHAGTYFFFWRLRRSFDNASIFVVPKPHEMKKNT